MLPWRSMTLYTGTAAKLSGSMNLSEAVNVDFEPGYCGLSSNGNCCFS